MFPVVYLLFVHVIRTSNINVTAWCFKATATRRRRVKDNYSTCDKCPIECPSQGCHGEQGHVLFNPACRQWPPPLTNCPTGQLLFVCVTSGTKDLPGLVVLMNTHNACFPVILCVYAPRCSYIQSWPSVFYKYSWLISFSSLLCYMFLPTALSSKVILSLVI